MCIRDSNTGIKSDKVPLMPTRCFLLFNHSPIHCATLSVIPWDSSLSIRLLNGTLSKAFAKSKNTTSTFSPESTQPVTLSKTTNNNNKQQGLLLQTVVYAVKPESRKIPQDYRRPWSPSNRPTEPCPQLTFRKKLMKCGRAAFQL